MTAAAPSGAEAAQMPFIRNLASSDRRLRTQSLEALQAFVGARRALTPPDAARLWTGLFHALWMTDRPRPQQALCDALAGLLFELPPGHEAAVVWLRAFWAVVSARWPAIDALRLDKFLLLVRRVFAAHVRWALTESTSSATAAQVMVDDVLRDACFDADDDAGVALGLRLHALDIWVDELERAGALAAGADSDLVARLGRLVDALRRGSRVKSVRRRADESYADARLPWATVRPDDDDDDDDGWGGFED